MPRDPALNNAALALFKPAEVLRLPGQVCSRRTRLPRMDGTQGDRTAGPHATAKHLLHSRRSEPNTIGLARWTLPALSLQTAWDVRPTILARWLV